MENVCMTLAEFLQYLFSLEEMYNKGRKYINYCVQKQVYIKIHGLYYSQTQYLRRQIGTQTISYYNFIIVTSYNVKKAGLELSFLMRVKHQNMTSLILHCIIHSPIQVCEIFSNFFFLTSFLHLHFSIFTLQTWHFILTTLKIFNIFWTI